MTSNNNRHNSNVNASEIAQRLQNGESLNLVDVREAIEYHTYNIGGKNLPLSRLKDHLDELPWGKSEEIIVICKVGLRSETAQSILTQNGYLHVRNLTGGLIALQKL